jgi:hypothetical protein
MDVHPPKYSKIGFDTSPFMNQYFGRAPFGFFQVVDLPLPQLAPFDAARLLARRARRPFFAADFEGGNSLPDVPLSMGRELLLRLRESPVMKEVKGAMGRLGI